MIDAEFAGDWQDDALAFDRVLESERLLNYFCDALPGETLAALQRARAKMFWKVSGARACQTWQFEPLSPGAPMGTWHRRTEKDQSLALFYWQGAEEIRLFGPSVPGVKPTDKRQFACDQNLRMLAVDAHKISLEQGRWYFDAQSCEAASESDSVLPGCVGALAQHGSEAATPKAASAPEGAAVEPVEP